MKHPYTEQPSRAFWSRSVSRVALEQVDPVSAVSFTVAPETRIATAGSCFAQHIARYLRSLGIEPLVTERPHVEVEGLGAAFHYGVYTARYGNLYTSRQLLQLMKRAYGEFEPEEPPWRGASGEWIDPFRPLIPGGFATLREFEHDRQRHLAAVREMFETLDVLIFTLGLTETWESKADGAVFPSCPGAVAGDWSPARYQFLNLTVDQVSADLSEFFSLLRHANPNSKSLLTVSPVPLVATATAFHVLPATTYSKSVLRVAAQQIADTHEGIDYFPSFEIIAGPQAGVYYEADKREVRPEGVAAVMQVFGRHYVQGQPAPSPTAESPQTESDTARANRALEVFCEELYNDNPMIAAN